VTNEECSDGAYCNGAEVWRGRHLSAGHGARLQRRHRLHRRLLRRERRRLRARDQRRRLLGRPVCSGAETCSAVSGCLAGTPPIVDDGVSCTVDACDEGTDTITHAANDAACADGLYCNGAETCNVASGCQGGHGAGLLRTA